MWINLAEKGVLLAVNEAVPIIVSIGLIADIHYADKPDSRTRFYRSSVLELDEAVQYLNKEQLASDFVGSEDGREINDKMPMDSDIF